MQQCLQSNNLPLQHSLTLATEICLGWGTVGIGLQVYWNLCKSSSCWGNPMQSVTGTQLICGEVQIIKQEKWTDIQNIEQLVHAVCIRSVVEDYMLSHIMLSLIALCCFFNAQVSGHWESPYLKFHVQLLLTLPSLGSNTSIDLNLLEITPPKRNQFAVGTSFSITTKVVTIVFCKFQFSG
jgi:hypothetical protein